MEEQELIRRLRERDDAAYRAVIDTYQSSILNCCYRFVSEKETAEDLTQEVFIEVYRSIGSFRSESKFSTWLYRIAITKSLDYVKSRKRKKRSGIFKNLFPESEPEARTIASNDETPHELLENEERRRMLTWAVDALPENQKAAFTLSKHNELTTKEIADILGTSIPSVESLIFRAKSNLRKKLYRYYKSHL